MNEERDDVIVLTDDNGNETEFEYLDTVEMDNKEYVVLLPIEENAQSPSEDAAEEVLILKVEKDSNGDDVFSSIENEDEVSKVFEQFKAQADADEFEFVD
jgi:uncharacterized protein YrzB (UPF0473 family)